MLVSNAVPSCCELLHCFHEERSIIPLVGETAVVLLTIGRVTSFGRAEAMTERRGGGGGRSKDGRRATRRVTGARVVRPHVILHPEI